MTQQFRDTPIRQAVAYSVEQSDDRKRNARELADRSNKLYAMRRAGFVERYVKADIHLAVRYRGAGRYHHGFIVKAELMDGNGGIAEALRSDAARD